MEIKPLEPADREALERFLARVPEGDRTFFKEDVEAPEVVDAWTRPGPARALAVDAGDVVGYSRWCRCTAGRATSARSG
jgi:hypothetical protein